jgi:plastocyanin
MALLRVVRHARRRPRLNAALRPLAGLLVLVGLVSACRRSDPDLQPEAVLKDSLGLSDRDRVHRIQLSSPDNVETPAPDSVAILPGDYVEFLTTDGKVHAVSFVLDSLPSGGADFMKGAAQEASPPLVSAESRFLVTFTDAPAGRYPFVVAGNGTEGRGAIVVGRPPR